MMNSAVDGEQEADLNIWEGILQQLDRALSQTIWVKGLFSRFSFQVLRCLHNAQSSIPRSF